MPEFRLVTIALPLRDIIGVAAATATRLMLSQPVNARPLGSEMNSVSLEIEPDLETPGCAAVCVTADAGSTALRFMLDSGAARTQIVAGVIPITELTGIDDESGGVFGPTRSETGELAELSLAGVRRGPMRVNVAAAESPEGEPTRNLIGADFLDGHRWAVSFSEETLAAMSPEGLEPLPWHIRRGARGHVLMTATWGDVRANACWDTGAGITVVDATFAAHHPGLFEAHGSAVGSDGFRSQPTDTVRMQGPRLESLAFSTSVAAVVDLSAINATQPQPLDLILGYPLLSQADWVVDLANHRWSARLRT